MQHILLTLDIKQRPDANVTSNEVVVSCKLSIYKQKLDYNVIPETDKHRDGLFQPLGNYPISAAKGCKLSRFGRNVSGYNTSTGTSRIFIIMISSRFRSNAIFWVSNIFFAFKNFFPMIEKVFFLIEVIFLLKIFFFVWSNFFFDWIIKTQMSEP